MVVDFVWDRVFVENWNLGLKTNDMRKIIISHTTRSAVNPKISVYNCASLKISSVSGCKRFCELSVIIITCRCDKRSSRAHEHDV